jgi:hypothetical protein
MNSLLSTDEKLTLILEHQEDLLDGQRESVKLAADAFKLQETILAALEALGLGVAGIPPLLDKMAESNAALTNAVLVNAGEVFNPGVEYD